MVLIPPSSFDLKTNSRTSGGFTLIEVVISLAIMMVALLGAAPFAQGWMDQSRLNTNTGLVRQAIAKARGLAQRNPLAVTSSSASATLCEVTTSATTTLYLHPGSPSACGVATGTNAFTWSATLSGGAAASVYINSTTTAMTCITFSNYGSSISGTVGSTSCPSATTFSITTGSASTSLLTFF